MVKEERFRFQEGDANRIHSNQFCYLECIIFNAGAENAINMNIINEFSIPYVSLKDEKSYIFFKLHIKKKKKLGFNIELSYTDIQEIGKYSQKISFFVECKDGIQTISPLEKSNQVDIK